MYKISRMPAVFNTSMTTNQTLSSRRADFHKARPFQTRDQMISRLKPAQP